MSYAENKIFVVFFIQRRNGDCDDMTNIILPMEKQVCRFELSKQLKELRVKQESAFYWIERLSGYFLVSAKELGDCSLQGAVNYCCGDVIGIYSAFTVAELGEMLPVHATLSNGKIHWLRIHKTLEGWVVGYFDNTMPLQFVADTEADARAKMLIYLIKEGLVKP